MKHLLIFVFTFFTLSLFGQNLVLKSSNSKKVFKSGKFLSIMVDVKKEDNCQCETIEYYGELISSEAENIRLKVHSENYIKVLDDESVVRKTEYESGKIQEKLIQNSQIIGIAKRAKPKGKKSKDVIGGIGAMLVVGGLVSTGNGLTLGDSKSRGNMAIIGVTQIAVGITLAVIGYGTKKYLVKSEYFPEGEFAIVPSE